RSRAVVLYYHRIGAPDILTRPADQFRNDLAYLSKRYRCTSLSDLCEQLKLKRPLRWRSVVITFDDGYRDNYLLAAPILSQSGVTATFFVSTGFVGTDREFDHDHRHDSTQGPARSYAKLTWGDLRAMEAAGLEIGSHTVNHTNLAQAD